MKGKRYTTEDKIRILREADTGKSILDACREHNISRHVRTTKLPLHPPPTFSIPLKFSDVFPANRFTLSTQRFRQPPR